MGVLLAVLLSGMAMMAACAPPTSAPLEPPLAGCYPSMPPGNRGLSYTGTPDVKSNVTVHAATDNTCTGGVEPGTEKATLVVASNRAEAVAKCLDLWGLGYDSTYVTLFRSWAWDLGPSAWAC